MSSLFWAILAGFAVLYFVGSAIIVQLRLIVDRVGALAEATWRVRDELTQINKGNGL